MKMKKIIAVVLMITILFMPSSSYADSEAKKKGSVYLLNSYPELEDAWKKVAKVYKKATGVEVKIVTPMAGTYESKLVSEMSKEKQPTAFNLYTTDGQYDEYQIWKDYCMDLSGTKLAKWVYDKDMLISNGKCVYGIPYNVECYGLIVNKSIFAKYFSLKQRANTGCNSLEDINTFDELKAVTNDMQKKKKTLGIQGVFTSAGMDTSSDWRFKTHLLNMAITAEYMDEDVIDKDNISFTYANNFKKIWDLYLKNSTCAPSELLYKTGEDAINEFASGKAAIYQNGVWSWGEIEVSENARIKGEDIGYLPIYMGLKNEEKQGLATGTGYYLAVNAKASKADRQATIEFFEWLFGTKEGKKLVKNDLNFLTVFTTFNKNDIPNNPLMKAASVYLNNKKYISTTWIGMYSFPSEEFKNVVGYNMYKYACGEVEWSQLVSDTITSWSDEKNYFVKTEKPRYILLDKSKISLETGKSKKLSATVIAGTAANKRITWKSSNPKVVTVKKGIVKANRIGTAIITAKTVNGKKATCKVSVSLPKIYILNKKSCDIKSKINYSDISNVKNDKIVSYKVENKKIARINKKGIIKGIRKGTTTITIKMRSGAIAKYKLKVK